MKENGSFCLVLHGHLPWVVEAGWWPHGELWLHEAVVETWLPLLELVDRCVAEGIAVPLTLGLTPILLEQLAHPGFRTRFPEFLAERAARAAADAEEFDARGDAHLAFLARRGGTELAARRAQWDAVDGDVAGAFAARARAGHIELLTSNATHGFMPLILHDASARAQVRAGVSTSTARLGFTPRGAWLPECAYRPGGAWTPPVVHGDARYRAGVEELFADEGVGFFFVDASVFRGARSEGVYGPAGYTRVGWDQTTWDTTRAWRSVLEPHAVTSDGRPPRLVALARHPEVSEQVWSGQVGYPGDGRYLEFHKKHGSDGLRYWKVTHPRADLGQKDPYYPDDVQAAVYSHAQHFCATVRAVLARHAESYGRHGVVTASFDAELFGHWWHEGPAFLFEVFRALHHDPTVRPDQVSRLLAAHPPDKAARLPEGTWGAGGDLRVWLNDELKWMWEAAYRAEDRFLALHARLAWATDTAVAEALGAAARELLLLQASDWQFVITTRGAVDYGYRRFCEHLGRFDRACTIAERRAAGVPDGPVQAADLEEIRQHDAVFPQLDLAWWGA